MYRFVWVRLVNITMVALTYTCIKVRIWTINIETVCIYIHISYTYVTNDTIICKKKTMIKGKVTLGLIKSYCDNLFMCLCLIVVLCCLQMVCDHGWWMREWNKRGELQIHVDLGRIKCLKNRVYIFALLQNVC